MKERQRQRQIQGYLGCNGRYRGRHVVHVIGRLHGPCLVTIGASPEEAYHEYQERFGARVELDDPALDDYPGQTIEDRILAAQETGDVHVNDGGTMTWVDPYEWASFDMARAEAREFFRSFLGRPA